MWKNHSRRWRAWIALWMLLSAPVEGQNFTLDEAWRWVRFSRDSGLPADAVYDVVETSAGTVWAATSKGIAWYDGFRWHAVGKEAGLPTARPTAMVAADPDRLLIVAEGRLFEGNREGFSRIPTGRDSVGLKIRAAVPLPEGGTLILAGSTFYAYQGGVLKPLEPSPEISFGRNPSLWKTPGGEIWLCPDQGLYRWNGDRWLELLPDVIPNQLVGNKEGEMLIDVVHPGEARGLWELKRGSAPRRSRTERMDMTVSMAVGPDGQAVVIYDSGEICIRRQGEWTSVEPLPPPMENAICLRFRENGDLWVGSEDGLFLYRQSAARWTYWRSEGPDLRNRLHEILRTRNGDIWLATAAGVEIRRQSGAVEWIERIRDVRLGVVTGLVEDDEGGVWISSGATFSGAYRWDGSEWRHFGPDQGLTASRVHKIRKDGAGRLWFLGLSALIEKQEPGAFVYEDGRFTRWGTEEGLLNGRVYAFAEGRDGARWFGTLGGLGRWRDGEWTCWTEKEGLRASRIFALAIDHEDRVWFADMQNGLGFIDAQDIPRYLTTADGLVHDEVWDLRTDGRGRLWIATQGGLGSYSDGAWSVLRTQHGLVSKRLWPVLPLEDQVYVGTRGNGVCILNLAEADESPPQIVIGDPVVEGRSALLRWQAFTHWGQLPPGQVETRYRLDAQPWSAWSTRREAVFKELDSGPHTFQVQAKGLLGNFDPAGRTATLAIVPPLHERPVFAIPVGVLLLSLLGLLVALAIRKKRHEEELHFLLTSARCLLWHAVVEERGDAFHWDIRIENEPSAQQFLPLAASPGQSYKDAWLGSRHPEDQKQAHENSAAALRAGQPMYSQELRHRRLDGEWRWLSEEVRVQVLGSRRWRLAGVCSDITERKRTEEINEINLGIQRIRNEILQMEEEEDWKRVVGEFHRQLSGLICYDGCGITIVDRVNECFHGYNVTAEGVEKGDVVGFLPRSIRSALERGAPVYRRSRREMAECGDNIGPGVNSVVDVPFTGGTVALNSAKEEAFSERDIEILEQFARSLSEAHRRLEDLKALALQEQHLRQSQRLELIDQLATGVAHEINNPLTLVIGYSKLLLKNGLEKDLRERVEVIHEGGVRAAAIAERLLTFSRLQKSDKQLLDLSEIVCQNLDLVRYEFEAQRVQLVEELAAALPQIEAHPGQLQQVVLNLVRNSRDAIIGARGEGRITVRTRLREGRIVLEVEDDGPGIPEQMRERIFEPFFTTRQVGQGTGLGLSVCQNIAREHGGCLRSESLERGARMVLELPIPAASEKTGKTESSVEMNTRS